MRNVRYFSTFTHENHPRQPSRQLVSVWTLSSSLSMSVIWVNRLKTINLVHTSLGNPGDTGCIYNTEVPKVVPTRPFVQFELAPAERKVKRVALANHATQGVHGFTDMWASCTLTGALFIYVLLQKWRYALQRGSRAQQLNSLLLPNGSFLLLCSLRI